MKTTKRFDLGNSKCAELFEPIITADFSISHDRINLDEVRYSVIIRGIEIDITNDVKWSLDKVCNRTKREQVLCAIADELSNEEALTKIEPDEAIELENQEA